MHLPIYGDCPTVLLSCLPPLLMSESHHGHTFGFEGVLHLHLANTWHSLRGGESNLMAGVGEPQQSYTYTEEQVKATVTEINKEEIQK